MKTVLFIQVTEPGAYPPLINAGHLMAKDGWKVSYLSSPVVGFRLAVTPDPGIKVFEMAERLSYIVGKRAFFKYCCRAIALARQLRPNVIYASDPIGALPGWLAAKLSGACLIYHEHDSPGNEGILNPVIRWARRRAAKAAEIVIFPNAERGRIAQEAIGFDANKLQIVWNVPTLRELPKIPDKNVDPLLLYYHGNISPELVPEALIEAMASFNGKVLLHLVGYEAPGAKGYINYLLNKWNRGDLFIIKYFGIVSRDNILQYASKCHVGIALMPVKTNDFNLKNLTGASNKAFDYMAAGLMLMVSELPEWRSFYSDRGFGVACDPMSVSLLKENIGWLVNNNEKIKIISNINRNMIEINWNYDKLFSIILNQLNNLK